MARFWSIGKGKRSSVLLNRSASPGPCAYSPTTTYGMPSWTMHGIKKRELYNIRPSPGPGTYDTSIQVEIFDRH